VGPGGGEREREREREREILLEFNEAKLKENEKKNLFLKFFGNFF
jgi:hypothetical protein